jgi:hypothetical protein
MSILTQMLQHVLHRHGGRVLRIQEIGHQTRKPKEGRSRDHWYFLGDVMWDDGKTTLGLEISPTCLVYEGEDRREVDELIEALNEYLAQHGQWCDGQTLHEGWYANDRK